MAVALGACTTPDVAVPPASSSASPGTGRPTTVTSSSGSGLSPVGARLLRLLRGVAVAETSYHPGYDRSCGPGHGCVFGEEWSDAHPGPFGHNGCDTRQDVLLEQLRDVELRWGSRCRIFQARLTDPYTGRALTWRDDGYRIQVDHVYPLAQAWYAGAWAWPQRRRVRLANDVELELLAVSAAANQDKGSQSPGDWLPPWRPFRCAYLVRYLRVARAYDLPVTPADAVVVRRSAPRC